MSAGAGEDVFSAIEGMNPMNMRERARLARRLFSQERKRTREARPLGT